MTNFGEMKGFYKENLDYLVEFSNNLVHKI